MKRTQVWTEGWVRFDHDSLLLPQWWTALLPHALNGCRHHWLIFHPQCNRGLRHQFQEFHCSPQLCRHHSYTMKGKMTFLKCMMDMVLWVKLSVHIAPLAMYTWDQMVCNTMHACILWRLVGETENILCFTTIVIVTWVFWSSFFVFLSFSSS